MILGAKLHLQQAYRQLHPIAITVHNVCTEHPDWTLYSTPAFEAMNQPTNQRSVFLHRAEKYCLWFENISGAIKSKHQPIKLWASANQIAAHLASQWKQCVHPGGVKMWEPIRSPVTELSACNPIGSVKPVTVVTDIIWLVYMWKYRQIIGTIGARELWNIPWAKTSH